MFDNFKLQQHLRDQRLDLTPTEKLVALILSTYRNKENGQCFPSQQKIALQCGLSRQHVNQTIKALKEKRVISAHKARFVGVRKKTVINYVFIFDKSA